MYFYQKVKKSVKMLRDVELTFYEMELGGGIYRICPCSDTDLFADDSLRLLLLRTDGRMVRGVLAFSNNNVEMKLKLLLLDDATFTSQFT